MLQLFLLLAQIAPPPPPSIAPPPPTWVATSPVGAPKVFEVTSVKISHRDGPGGSMRYGPGFLILDNFTLEGLVTWAYGMRDFQVIAPQPWFRSDRYDINAKAKGAPDIDHLKLLLQALLAERFGLVAHRETRERPIFTLSADGRATKMQTSTGPVPPDPRLSGHGNSSHQDQNGDHATIAEIVRMLNRWVERPIIDKTGLAGRYNLHGSP